GARDREARAVPYEPCPAGAEAVHAGVLELGLELVEAAELLVDRGSQVARGRATAVRTHDLPEERVVGVPAAVVAEHRLLVLGQLVEVLQDLLDRLVRPLCAL